MYVVKYAKVLNKIPFLPTRSYSAPTNTEVPQPSGLYKST